MIKGFFRWVEAKIIRWDLRSTPRHELQELYILLIMAARRCSYDMNHCAQDCEGERQEFWNRQSQNWERIFEVDSGKRYRHELHHKIWDLESSVDKYQKILEANNIPDPIKDNGKPF